MNIRLIRDYFVSNVLIPPRYAVIAIVIALCAVVFSKYCLKREKTQSFVIGLLALYLAWVISSTILIRASREDFHYEWMLFWSYREIICGDKMLLIENIVNLVMLIPVGVLLAMGFDMLTLRQVTITGFIISGTIEILQLISKRGLFEFDDILHNTIGCVLGYWLYKQIAAAMLQRRESKSLTS